MQASQGFQKRDASLILAHLGVAFTALFLGAVAGLLQALQRGGLITLPPKIGYYQLLTAHGVLLALIFTTFFIIGFLYAGSTKTLGGKMPVRVYYMGWAGFWLMLVGTILSTIEIVLNNASVLYTFYAPMKASPWFYIGLALVVIGSWISGFGLFSFYRQWKREQRGKISPLFAFMSVATMILWLIATLGVAAEVVIQLIPWSFGWVPTINVMLSRMLFWYFGHPLVYFWLLPAYISWYVCIPKIIGGKIFSDALARLSFVLFIFFSMPVGFHHQLMEPGIPAGWKYLQVVLTLAVVVPSLMTAFSLFATMESTGRARGGTGMFGWFKKLPWGDVRFLAPFAGMVWFIPAGAGGIINASNQMNAVVHNTLWVTGHFHLTVATSVALTFFGTAYWLVPVLTGRTLTPTVNRLGIIQTLIWSLGMLFMSGSMHTLGLLGDPRRTAFSTYQDNATALSWMPLRHSMAIGGMILFVGILLIIGIIIYLMFFAPKAKDNEVEFPIGEVAKDAEATPRFLERWGLWVGITFVLIIVAYGYPLVDMLQHAPAGSPPFRTW
jgi:cytochrome c oxidase subunit 1